MKTCCGQDVPNQEAKLRFCREHCKETSGCWGVSLENYLMPAQRRKLMIDLRNTEQRTEP